jgi:hypothetical protein
MTGKIFHADMSAPVACAILNQSRTGACLLVASTDGIPDTFDLVIDVAESESESPGTASACSVMWRTATRVGVRVEWVEAQLRRSPGLKD